MGLSRVDDDWANEDGCAFAKGVRIEYISINRYVQSDWMAHRRTVSSFCGVKIDSDGEEKLITPSHKLDRFLWTQRRTVSKSVIDKKFYLN